MANIMRMNGQDKNKELKYELVYSAFAQGGATRTYTLTKDYAYLVIFGFCIRGNTANQTINFSGSCNPQYLEHNANAIGGTPGSDYRKSTAISINPKKGQTLTWSCSWNGNCNIVGFYEE